MLAGRTVLAIAPQAQSPRGLVGAARGPGDRVLAQTFVHQMQVWNLYYLYAVSRSRWD
jgi:hypothetical protein